MPRTMISERLKNAIRTSSNRQWKIARRGGLHPVTLSNLVVGSRDVEVGDPRVVAIGRMLGVPEQECFEATASASRPGDNRADPRRRRKRS